MAGKSKPSRILLFTDGFSTEPLTDISDKLAARGCSLDYRLVRPANAADFRVSPDSRCQAGFKSQNHF